MKKRRQDDDYWVRLPGLGDEKKKSLVNVEALRALARDEAEGDFEE